MKLLADKLGLIWFESVEFYLDGRNPSGYALRLFLPMSDSNSVYVDIDYWLWAMQKDLEKAVFDYRYEKVS